jgi:hypothetical protein
MSRKTPTPEFCSRFQSCSAPRCPLDPDIEKHVTLPGEKRCTMAKATRVKYAAAAGDPMVDGLTGRERSGKARWDAMTPAEREEAKMRLSAALGKAAARP